MQKERIAIIGVRLPFPWRRELQGIALEASYRGSRGSRRSATRIAGT